MFKMIVGFVLVSSFAHATMPFSGMADSCLTAANMAALDSVGMMGIDPDGVAFNFDENGNTNILKPESIVSRANKDGVETIVYKARQPKSGKVYKSGETVEYETVQRTITVKRENGKIVSVRKEMDLASQIQWKKAFENTNFKVSSPLVKAFETTFNHDKKDCEINQTLNYEMEKEGAKIETKVSYDREFCQKLEPIFKQIGTQNASQCVGLINMAQVAFNQRAEDLAKDGKTFKVLDWLPKSKSGDGIQHLDLGSMINSCSMVGALGYGGGMYGTNGYTFGMGMVLGGGMGFVVGGPVEPVKTKTNKPAKTPAVK